jgi:hypothetical protein
MHENSPKKRLARRLERKAGQRPPYPRVLMVCEGSKTEKLYFDDIRQYWRISSADWEVLPSELGTGPEKVVEFAEQKAREEKKWDEVYCIFDRDDHVYYQTAIQKAKSLDGKIRPNDPIAASSRFIAIPSVPCFELWYLIHFVLITKELHRDKVYTQLKTEVPEYNKGASGMFERTYSRLSFACSSAENERKRKEQSGNDNPSTDVDILVNRLQEIGEMKTKSMTKQRGEE